MTTLYIVHGWAYSVEPWQATIKLLEKQGIKVKMLNVPGLTAPSDAVWTIDDYVEWAHKLLPENAVVLGHSNGGRILLNLCLKYPKQIKHLILLDAAGIYEPSKKRDFLQKIAAIGRPLKRLPFLRKFFHKLTKSYDYSRAPENMKTTLKNMLESDKTLDLTPIQTKITMLWGEKDTITPPRQAEKMHQQLKNSTLTFFPEWPHSPYLTDPEGLANAILEVLK